MSLQLTTLTEIEVLGLKSECNMADGHAYHDLAMEQLEIIDRLPLLWQTSAKKKHKQAEIDFRDAFSALANCPSLANFDHFRICPTASNSIDTVATWLNEKKFRTLLIEPTFDNLALILKRRGVEISSVTEEKIFGTTGISLEGDFNALFVVNPNNPTGSELTETEFTCLAHCCKQNNKVLLLDNTFRFFVKQSYDTYLILQECGVTFISIEDTGKVWPTQDMKASLIFFSKDIASEMHAIYEEIYLCVSNFQLEVLGSFLRDAAERGLNQAVWSEVAARRTAFRNLIADSPLGIHPDNINSKISVEWVVIKNGFGDDFEVMNLLKDHGLVVLPGRHFYWNANGPKIPLNILRFSLLKTKKQFEESLKVLAKALKEMT